MKVVFIRPRPSEHTIGLQHLMIVEPLELEILATLIEQSHHVEIIDMILEKESFSSILINSKPDIVCFTGYITHIPVIIADCRLAKKILPDIITIVGGVHVEKFPEDIDDPSINYRVVRNATRSFPQLIDYICNNSPFPKGVLKTHEKSEEGLLPEIDFFVPIPNRSLTAKYRKNYFYVFHNKVALLKTSFGCPFVCKFCFCREITGGLYHERPLQEVMAELETIKEKEIYIVDDDFLVHSKRVQSFINELKIRKLKKKFLIYGRADFIAKHPDIIKQFKEQGLRTIIVGLESFDDNELQRFNKKTTKNINSEALAVMNRYGVDCYAAVIISPAWNLSDFKKAASIMKELKIKFVNLQPLTPLKGIGVEVDEARLVIKRDDYARWDLAHISIQPENMSVEAFYQQILYLYKKIVYHPRNILSHMKHPLTMQWKMAKGIIRVHRQYTKRIEETYKDA